MLLKKISLKISNALLYIVLSLIYVVGFGAYCLILKVLTLFKKDEITYWKASTFIDEEHLDSLKRQS